MKSNYFVSTTAIVLIAHFITGFLLIATTFGHWWRKCLYLYCARWEIRIQERRRRRQRWQQQQQQQFRQNTQISSSDQQQQQQEQQSNHKMYQFRPFEVVSCDYKSYSRTSKGRGINIIPKARSGHRVAANEVDLFSFGGEWCFY